MTNYKTRRQQDYERTCKLEKACEILYQQNGMDVKRITDAKQQKEGIDFVCDNMLVDEKAAIKYWNKDLQTYSFEVVSHTNKNNQGWLFSNISKTTHYSLIWVRSNDEALDNLNKIEIMLISKKAIMDYLRLWNYDNAKSISNTLEWYGREHNGRISYNVNQDIRFVWSNNIVPERPINVIISKRLLSKMADKHMCYTA